MEITKESFETKVLDKNASWWSCDAVSQKNKAFQKISGIDRYRSSCSKIRCFLRTCRPLPLFLCFNRLPARASPRLLSRARVRRPSFRQPRQTSSPAPWGRRAPLLWPSRESRPERWPSLNSTNASSQHSKSKCNSNNSSSIQGNLFGQINLTGA